MTAPPNLPAALEEMTYAAAGDMVYLGSVVTNLHLWGQVSDLDTPAMMSGSFEILGNEGALVMDALRGERGIPGANAPIVKMQWSRSIQTPEDLPRNLGDNEVDVGKAWWIGHMVYVWDGHRYQIHEMGTAGPAGPIPRITPHIQQIPQESDEPDSIDVTGTALRPHWLLRAKFPRGPAGPSAAIRNADDYDDSEAMDIDKVLTVRPGTAPGQFLWGPRHFVQRHVRQYTVPEGAFQNFVGFTQRHTICSYQIEPQPYDYVPHVNGHIKAWGLETLFNMTIGVEVRLGDAVGGTLVARGHGNSALWSTISPHFSDKGNPMEATSPSNQVGMVRAGETANLFLSLVNDGLLGAYIYDKSGSQMSVLTVAQESGVPSMVAETWSQPGSYLWQIPDWCQFIEVVMVSAGGGSSDGTALAWGKGGGRGQWFGGTLERGVQIPRTTTALQLVVPAGGINAPWEPGQSQFPAGNGGNVTVSGTGLVTLQALGGLYAANQTGTQGQGAGNFIFNGRTHYGGRGGAVQWFGDGNPGEAPGGGAGGAGLGGSGARGGAGRIWIRARR